MTRRALFSSIVQWENSKSQKQLINTGNLHHMTLSGLVQCQEALIKLYIGKSRAETVILVKSVVIQPPQIPWLSKMARA